MEDDDDHHDTKDQLTKKLRNKCLLHASAIHAGYEPMPEPLFSQPRSVRIGGGETPQQQQQQQVAAASTPMPCASYTYAQVLQIVEEERRLASVRLAKALEQQKKECRKEYEIEFAQRMQVVDAERREEKRQQELYVRGQREPELSYYS